MGIYDRDYYRNEGPSFLGSYVGTGRACMILVAINVVVYIAQLVTIPPRANVYVLDEYRGTLEPPRREYGPLTDWLAMKPRETFQKFQVWRLLTGAFLHSPDNFWHLIWNMFFLWIFGRDLEDLYGRKEFIAFYLVAGVVGNLLWGLTALWQEVVHGSMSWALGASGAVMAVTVLCALHFPYRTIYMMFVLPLPYWAYALLLVALDLYAFVRHANVGVAVAAHLGGALFGALYWHLQIRLLDFGGRFVDKARRSQAPRLRAYTESERESPPVRAPAVSDRIDPQLARNADAVLEKISRQGKDSLTQEEQAILQRASEEFRKRRQ
jgi:membrane associated rhomboid family serine protease